MRRYWWIIVVLIMPTMLYAQAPEKQRSTPENEALKVMPEVKQTPADSMPTWKPDASKAVWIGVIAPGGGQIYNRSYWKLPIVYGAFMGCGYAISTMQNRYSGYKIAYLDLYNDVQAGTVSEDPSKSYIAVLPNGYTLSQVGGSSTWMNTLKNRQNIYRRYRDYSILATVAVYALSLIDAYVDAQLFDYDISPDLSIHIRPQLEQDIWNRHNAELKLAIQF